MSDKAKRPAIMPASGCERPLAQVELGDIVRLRKPYEPGRGFLGQKGPFGFRIVAEILTVLPDGRTRNVSLYLYDPNLSRCRISCRFPDARISCRRWYTKAEIAAFASAYGASSSLIWRMGSR
jgi:hypothetical protein